jgi:dienelactone hydrolase
MASLIPGYEYDIFISYRQKDNKYDGWVTEFVDNLRKELEATFKEEVSVYFDINPHDGLLETHDVGDSLKDKLKCLVFIPILSRTYCDPNSFAWVHEFKAFVDLASNDQYGLKVKLPHGNVSNRVLPVRIHDLDDDDVRECESVLGGVLRGVEFIYKSAGVNRSLRSQEDNPHDNISHTIYRDQINKVALAIKDIIGGMLHQDNRIEPEIKAEVEKTFEKKEKRKTDGSEHKKWLVRRRSLDSKGLTKKSWLILTILVLIILGFFSVRFLIDRSRQNYAKFELIPQIQKMTEENFTAPFRAFELASEARKIIPGDSVLDKLWIKISQSISLQTQPPGASVSWKDYSRPDDPWNEIGITPLNNVRVPVGYLRISIEKEGFIPVLLTRFSLYDVSKPVKLDSIGSIPSNMARIPSQVTQMFIVGVEIYGNKRVGEFLADQFEVTNKEYQKFVDEGGYSDRKYWKHPFYIEGKPVPWEVAITSLLDKTGKPGPAGWEVGKYPEGQGNHAVTGVSWYEASAYAEYAGKRLPTVYQWSVLAETNRSMNIIPLSNYNGKSTVPVGSLEGVSSYGIYDIAGNAREWCFNGNGINGEAYILGGGWNDPSYAFNDAGIQPCFDRSISNGFRCVKVLPGDSTIKSLSDPIILSFRNYSIERPVDDKTFGIFLRQYAYDRTPLNATLITEADTGTWKIEKVTMDAGYNNERLTVYLYFPRDKKPPFQPIIYFPGSNAIHMDMIASNYVQRLDFIVKSGRVLVYPVLAGTFDRKDGFKSDLQEETVLYKDHVIMWRKDIGRTIDYLETRSDILSDKIGYFGWSWGGFMGGIIPAVERRIKAVVLHVGGMEMQKALPEADQINFLPRVYQPVLMLNGKYDMYFPVETSQRPMFNFLGTPAKDKKMIIYDTGHLVPRSDLIKETLTWFDKYIGPVGP